MRVSWGRGEGGEGVGLGCVTRMTMAVIQQGIVLDDKEVCGPTSMGWCSVTSKPHLPLAHMWSSLCNNYNYSLLLVCLFVCLPVS